MSRLKSLASTLKLKSVRLVVPAFCVVMVLLSAAAAQDFTMTMKDFFPFAVNPGGQANANLSLSPTGTTAGTVTLGCTVTDTTGAIPAEPQCVVSPTNVTPPGSATAIVTTLNSSSGTVATPGNYTVTVTATNASTTNPVTTSKDLSVLATTADYTLSVTTLVAPSSVVAGNTAQGQITVNPLNGYNGVVTLACSSISPVTINPPFCTFTYPSGQFGLPVPGVPTSTTLTITTLGPIPTTSLMRRGFVYAFWLPIPAIFLLSAGSSRNKRGRKAAVLLGIFVATGVFLLIPACGYNGPPTNNALNVTTPANTYKFTLTGVDQNGIVSSNATSTSSAPTVSLTVTAPK